MIYQQQNAFSYFMKNVNVSAVVNDECELFLSAEVACHYSVSCKSTLIIQTS